MSKHICHDVLRCFGGGVTENSCEELRFAKWYINQFCGEPLTKQKINKANMLWCFNRLEHGWNSFGWFIPQPRSAAYRSY